MLPSRSARLAAILLLVLLFGWTVRAWRKGQTTHLPAVEAPVVEKSSNTQPDD